MRLALDFGAMSWRLSLVKRATFLSKKKCKLSTTFYIFLHSSLQRHSFFQNNFVSRRKRAKKDILSCRQKLTMPQRSSAASPDARRAVFAPHPQPATGAPTRCFRDFLEAPQRSRFPGAPAQAPTSQTAKLNKVAFKLIVQRCSN